MSAPWFACEQTERPPDMWVEWHYEDCDQCRFKASVQVQRFPDDPHVAWLVDLMNRALS